MVWTDRLDFVVPHGNDPDEIRLAFQHVQEVLKQIEARAGGEFLLNENGDRVTQEGGLPVIVS